MKHKKCLKMASVKLKAHSSTEHLHSGIINYVQINTYWSWACFSANITIHNVTGIISEPQKLPDIVEFMLFPSVLGPESSSLFWLILPPMLNQSFQLHDQLI
jgi:hypothetical protein